MHALCGGSDGSGGSSACITVVCMALHACMCVVLTGSGSPFVLLMQSAYCCAIVHVCYAGRSRVLALMHRGDTECSLVK